MPASSAGGLDVPNVVGFHQRVSVTAQEVCRAQTIRPPGKLFSKLLRRLEIPEDDAHRLTDVVTALTSEVPKGYGLAEVWGAEVAAWIQELRRGQS